MRNYPYTDDNGTLVKKCPVCGGVFPATTEYFHASNTLSGGIYPECKKCKNAKRKPYTHKKGLKNSEYNREYLDKRRAKDPKAFMQWRNKSTRRWQKENPQKYAETQKRIYQRRAAAKKTFTDSDWFYALSYFDNCCAVCGRSATTKLKIVADHWIPLSDPNCPGTVPTNIVPLCNGRGGCNTLKTNKDAREWLEKRYGKLFANHKMAQIEAYFNHLRTKTESGE